MLIRFAALLILVAPWILTPLPAQDPAQVLEDVRKRLTSLLGKQTAPVITEIEALIGELETLYHAPAEVREKACRFLRAVLQKGGVHDARLRIRLSVLRVLAGLADEPEWAERLMELGTRGGRGTLKGLEFWVERALGTMRTPGHVQRLLAYVRSEDPQARLLALGALARLENPEHVPMIVPLLPRLRELASHENPEVVVRVLAVLSRLHRLDVLPPLFKAVRDPDPFIRLAAVRALKPKVALPGVVAFLSRLLTDDVALVREEAVIALEKAPDRSAVPVLVARLEKEPLRIRMALAKTLQAITGFEYGPEFGPWASWLKSTKAANKLHGADVRKPPPSPYAKPPEYFDIPVLSDRMLFIIDVSGSMGYSVGDSTKTPTRMEHAKLELVNVLKRLDERSRFNILFFARHVAPWTAGLVPATKHNKEQAIAAVSALVPRGGTNSYGALELAFNAFRSIDTIYFLSDGIPSIGKSISQERIIQKVWDWNRLRGVRIHTISLLVGEQLNPFRRKREDKDDAARFMRILAEETGGTFKDLR
ncbi:MAG: hypothetical protein CMJ83_12960 [Planctomycetes bacterium]|nr:hypothetical protein [Planctomycetota bacterium]